MTKWSVVVLTALLALVCVWILMPSDAVSQSCANSNPNLTGGGNVFGRLSSAWNQYFSGKVDSINGVLCNPTIVGPVYLNLQGLPTVGAGTGKYLLCIDTSVTPPQVYVGTGPSCS